MGVASPVNPRGRKTRKVGLGGFPAVSSMFHPTQETLLLHIFLAGRRDPDLLPQLHSTAVQGMGAKSQLAASTAQAPTQRRTSKAPFKGVERAKSPGMLPTILPPACWGGMGRRGLEGAHGHGKDKPVLLAFLCIRKHRSRHETCPWFERLQRDKGAHSGEWNALPAAVPRLGLTNREQPSSGEPAKYPTRG